MHHSLKNYGESTSVAFEEKPIYIKFSGNEISVSKHRNRYNFEDAEDTVNRKTRLTGILIHFTVSCLFVSCCLIVLIQRFNFKIKLL